MQITPVLKLLDVIAKELNINHNQALYLLYKYYHKDCSVGLEAMVDLMNKNLLSSGTDISMTANAYLQKTISSQARVEKRLPNKENSKISTEGKVFCKAIKAKLMKTISKEEAERYTEVVAEAGGDSECLNWFALFMKIFPSPKDNKDWNAHFGVAYTGVTLRIASKGTVKTFVQLYKRVDISLVVLGAYVMMKEGVKRDQNTTFIKKLDTFFKEVEHWMFKAEEAIKAKTKSTKRDNIAKSDDNTVDL